jgi:para-aminobenzoate synthetase/4-amino-4-deoxychorismate lyase
VELRFDFASSDGRPQPRVFRRPHRVIVARTVEDVLPAMAAVDAARRDGHWVAGAVAYEAAPAFDRALVTQAPPAAGPPLVWFGVFDAPEPDAPLTPPVASPPQWQWRSTVTPAAHAAGVAAIREAIADGVTYQINYTLQLQAPATPGHARDVYAALASAEGVPYGACLSLDDWRVISLSPELFFRVEPGADGDRIVTQPMKGTSRRGRWPAEDDTRAAALRASEKNRAENVMIVDLARNDLTQVAEPGSVSATELFRVDRYASVLQMVSTVEGRCRRETSLTSIFRALFPAGSITGAPKSSSMRLIASLEASPRGLYCGAIGYAAPDGEAVFNVAIRTITIAPDGTAAYGIGGGITWDSDARDEYAEALSKAACLTVRPSVHLFETLRLDRGVAVRRDAHLARMAASARYFRWPFTHDAAVAAIDDAAARHPGGAHRLRLRTDPRGRVTVEVSPLEPTPSGVQPIAHAREPIDARDPARFHKTSDRAIYERHAAAHPDAFDVLLWNAAGEATEFTRANVVFELDGELVTPPLQCGLLPGVLRAELIASGRVRECAVRVAEVGRATRIWSINSLREWIPVRLEPDAAHGLH